MKNSCFLFALLALAPLARAQIGLSTYAQIMFVRGVTSGEQTIGSAPLTYADGSVALPGEQFGFVFAVPKSGIVLSTTATGEEVPFAIAADGTLQAKEDNLDVLTWATLATANAAEITQVVGEDGLPAGTWQPLSGGNGEYRLMSFYWPNSAGTRPMRYAYLYCVVFDTRVVDPQTGETTVAVRATDGKAPTPLAAYGASFCHRFEATPMGVKNIAMNLPEGMTFGGYSGATTIAAIQETAPLSSIVVAGETLTDPTAIEAALKPAISGMSLAQGGGTPTLSLTLSPAQAPDITTYTLETADALDGTWVPFDTFLQEKGLANSDAMRYTKWRIKEEGVVSIPVFNDTTRFYRLKGDKNLQGETR